MAEHVPRLRETRNTYRILWETSRERSIWILMETGRQTVRWMEPVQDRV